MEYEFYPNKAAIKKVKSSSVHQNVVVPVEFAEKHCLQVLPPVVLSPCFLCRVELEAICGDFPIEPYISVSINIPA